MEPLVIVGLLLLAAMVLAILEVLTPSCGLLSAAAIVSALGAIYMSFAYAQWLGYVMMPVVLIGSVTYMSLMVRILPHTPIGKRIFLPKAEDGTGQGTPEAETFEKMIGRKGTAATLLRPTGMVRIDSKRLPAHAETGMIEKDTPIVVVGADSMNLIVRKTDNEA